MRFRHSLTPLVAYVRPTSSGERMFRRSGFSQRARTTWARISTGSTTARSIHGGDWSSMFQEGGSYAATNTSMKALSGKVSFTRTSPSGMDAVSCLVPVWRELMSSRRSPDSIAPPEQGPFDDNDLSFFERVKPHLECAAQIQNRMNEIEGAGRA